MTRVAIIGSGIAGSSVAYALQRYGAQVSVYEQAAMPATEASGNPAALVMPRLDADDTPVARFHRAAFIHATLLYESLGAFTTQGVIDTSHDDAKRAKLASNLPLPADWLTIHPDHLFHHRGGVIVPTATIAAMLQGCTVHCGIRADPDNLMDQHDIVVIAAGRLLGDSVAAPFSYRAGQVDWADGTTATPYMGNGYVAALDDGILFGATHDMWDDPHVIPTTTSAATAKNIEKLEEFGIIAPHTIAGSRSSIRAALPDRMPLAGMTDNRLYAIGALGARGFTTAPLLGEYIASHIMGIAIPLLSDIEGIVSANRYSRFDKSKASG
jgi:tRNA 5-methylaminomethyl-2-thiouridine biosynthesis bifunctional protein